MTAQAPLTMKMSSDFRTKNYFAETISSKMKKVHYEVAGWDNSLEALKTRSKITNKSSEHSRNVYSQKKCKSKMYPLQNHMNSFANQPHVVTGTAIQSLPYIPPSICENVAYELQNQSSNNTSSQNQSSRDESSDMSTSSVRVYGTEIFMGKPWYYETSICKGKRDNINVPGYSSKSRSYSLDRRNLKFKKPFGLTKVTKMCKYLDPTSNGNKPIEQTKADQDHGISLLRMDMPVLNNSEECPGDAKNIHLKDFGVLECKESLAESVATNYSSRKYVDSPSACSELDVPSEGKDLQVNESQKGQEKKQTFHRTKIQKIKFTPNCSDKTAVKSFLKTSNRNGRETSDSWTKTKGSKVKKWYKQKPTDLVNPQSWSLSLERLTFRECTNKRKSMQFVRTPFEQSQKKSVESKQDVLQKTSRLQLE